MTIDHGRVPGTPPQIRGQAEQIIVCCGAARRPFRRWTLAGSKKEVRKPDDRTSENQAVREDQGGKDDGIANRILQAAVRRRI